MSDEEKLQHNRTVIGNVMTALIQQRKADPVKLLCDRQYAAKMVTTYMEAANLARSMMGMPQLFLYNMNVPN